ncbi:hypothetical protein DKX38_007489 [Salix brachista]|uniref:ATP synthase 24 kDa subunit, mitochondrial n=1 Tax=Salix brachista TaxID=2182728 RepID=A0A5N5MN35_9ROSI|nr:hypothetical protein DKX38_007489 [Salix brachista]
MAFSYRLLSRSKQLYGSQAILNQQLAFPVRYYAKEAAPDGFKGDEMLKDIFRDLKKKFDTAIGVFRKEKIIIDPEDPAAVSHYAKVMKTAREKAGLLSESQRIQYTIEEETKDIPDARTYLLQLQEIRIKRNLPDELGVEAMMMDVLEKVEKEIKKPLMRNDKKGMALLMAEFDKINTKVSLNEVHYSCMIIPSLLKPEAYADHGCLMTYGFGSSSASADAVSLTWQKLGVRREDLPKYEEELELKIAKAQLEELKKDAVEAMETQRKREEFKEEKPVDVRSLDIRNFL